MAASPAGGCTGFSDEEIEMKAKIGLVTLGVRDFPRMLAFYRDGLGFPTHNFNEGDDFAMFRLEGSWLALFGHEALADDLERWLIGKPVLARRISVIGRLWRWCRRRGADRGSGPRGGRGWPGRRATRVGTNRR